MSHRRIRLLLTAVLLSATAGCDDPAGPPVVDGSDLIFIRPRPNSPPLAANEVSFWAKRGEDVEVRLPYVTGHECLRFRIRDDGLATRPDGTRFEEGDSIRITIRLTDPEQYNFEFQPAGLRFNPDEPAELRVSYAYADPDIDQDGDVDDDDQREFDDAGFWRQERVGEAWTRIGTARLDATEDMRAELNGFTRYALASN